jgi:hypothetical protein
MIKVWILLVALNGMNPIPPMADQASCEKVRDYINTAPMPRASKCEAILIPAPSREAWFALPQKLESK